jgi:hypothetical protein
VLRDKDFKTNGRPAYFRRNFNEDSLPSAFDFEGPVITGNDFCDYTVSLVNDRFKTLS